jgi:hypothetical protein
MHRLRAVGCVLRHCRGRGGFLRQRAQTNGLAQSSPLRCLRLCIVVRSIIEIRRSRRFATSLSSETKSDRKDSAIGMDRGIEKNEPSNRAKEG